MMESMYSNQEDLHSEILEPNPLLERLNHNTNT
jgi:hypothetical protein